MLRVKVVNQHSPYWEKTLLVKPEEWASESFWIPAMQLGGAKLLMARRSLTLE